MATFDTLESSVEESRPIEVYQFAQGSTVRFFTSFQTAVTMNGDLHVPETITRGKISQGVDARRRTLTITGPSSNEFAAQYVNIVPSQKATLSIIRLQRDESPTFDTQVLVYKGQVRSVRFPQDGHTAEIGCQTIESAASQNIPRYTYMSLCNHILYGAGCGVDPLSFNVIGAASAVSGSVLDVAGLNTWQTAGGWSVVGGYATPTLELDPRLIVGNTGDQIELLLPFGTDVSGMDVQVFAGCDHDVAGDCGGTFDNVIEHGGFPFVPSKNPFQTGLD
jgi:hypothetical protein